MTMECFTILILGLVAFFALTLGIIGLGFFGIGAIVYGLGVFSDRPAAGIGWIAVGIVCLGIFSKIGER